MKKENDVSKIVTDTVSVYLELPEKLHRRFKSYCAIRRKPFYKTLRLLLEKAIEEELKNYNPETEISGHEHKPG